MPQYKAKLRGSVLWVEAISKFNEYRQNTYDYSDDKAKLTMGVSIGMSELDIVHVRNNQNFLVADFMGSSTINTNKQFLEEMVHLNNSIGFDKIRLFQNEQGERLKKPLTLSYKEWNNQFFDVENTKFRLSEESKVLDMPGVLECQNPITVYRIEALRDFVDVKAGDKGGWVEKKDNLSQMGNSWIYGEAVVVEDALVRDDAVVHGNALVVYQAVIKDKATVTGHALVAGSAEIADEAHVSGSCCVIQEAKLCNNAKAEGRATIGGYAVLEGHAVVANNDELYDGILRDTLCDYQREDEHEM